MDFALVLRKPQSEDNKQITWQVKPPGDKAAPLAAGSTRRKRWNFPGADSH
jgi:hypothetical protein